MCVRPLLFPFAMLLLSACAGASLQGSAVPRCRANEDCPDPTAVCSEHGICTFLRDPVCGCDQPNTLRCIDGIDKRRARHTFCRNGCRDTPGGSECMH